MSAVNSTLCYIENGGKYLMLHRVKKENDQNRDKWIGIGGKFERFESPEDCILREAREETGLTLDPAKGRIALPLSGRDWFGDVWVFRQEISMDDIRLQEGETCEAKLVTRDELLRLRENDLFIPCSYMDELFTLLFGQDP